MAQSAEYPLCKHEALSSNPNPTKQISKQQQQQKKNHCNKPGM
jgi:hypothetical protein